MKIYSAQMLPGSCGVGILYGFRDVPQSYYSPGYGHTFDRPVKVGGVGIHCAAYVSTKVCREMYEAQHKKYKIVFQSEARVNSNSRRKFIFVVYDRKAEVSADMNKDHKFPFRPRTDQ